MLKVLITGGAGYIGSTVASACIDAGITPVIIDNLSSGHRDFVRGRAFYRGDIADDALLARIFADHPDLTAAIHCAALVAVDGSLRDPLAYYRENVAKTGALVESLSRHGCHRLIFSSSAAVYGPSAHAAVDEETELAAGSPYGRTKVIAEQLLEDVSHCTELRVIALRYFNPIGADPRLRSGSTLDREPHVLGHMIRAHADRTTFTITGVDFPTRDGSGLRDYVHVWDLARGHVAALQHFDTVVPVGSPRRFEPVNLGSGSGVTVRELVDAFERATGRPLAVREAAPRPGDVAGYYAATGKAERLLDWRPGLSVADGISSAIAWAAVAPASAAEMPALVA